MARIKMLIPKAKLPFYPPYEVKYRLQNGVSTVTHPSLIPLFFLQPPMLVSPKFDAKNFSVLFMSPGMEIVESKQHWGFNKPNDI